MAEQEKDVLIVTMGSHRSKAEELYCQVTVGEKFVVEIQQKEETLCNSRESTKPVGQCQQLPQSESRGDTFLD